MSLIQQDSLIDDTRHQDAPDTRPLADRLRPRTLTQIYGQQHLLADGKPLQQAVVGEKLHSMVLWGPPGTGKTTLARMIAHNNKAQFIPVLAVLDGVKDIRRAIEQAKAAYLQSTVVFVDEVHRFNKSQQDAFLPYIENGLIYFIGATTENPSFELNNALLSRTRTYVLKPLDESAIWKILQHALTDTDDGLGKLAIEIEHRHIEKLVAAADGDARRALNLLDLAVNICQADTQSLYVISDEIIANTISSSLRRFDKKGDMFYEQISALHKSLRGSDPNAALYWLARMLDGGCDPLYIARRIVRMASEDIGNADPRAMSIALDAYQIFERLGSPEGELAIAQAVSYLACAPKSNAVYTAFKAALHDVKTHGSHPVPDHLCNAPTQLMKTLGHGKHYRYVHDEPEGYAAGEHYFPTQMKPQSYYQPVNRGLEDKIAKRLKRLTDLDQDYRQSKGRHS